MTLVHPSPYRPPLLVVVAGTGTDMGKTWVACQLAHQWRARGLAVAARKPAQSFAPDGTGATDADLLAAATGQNVSEVCPPWRWYPRAMAPPMAAEALGYPPFTLDDLVSETAWPPATHIGLVELAGGVGSPQASDGDGVDLVQRLSPDRVVLVAGPGLGTLSHSGLTLRAFGDQSVVVYLNHFDGADDIHEANRKWLASHVAAAVTTDPRTLSELLTHGTSAESSGA
jgi:dethiobiotin synthetase